MRRALSWIKKHETDEEDMLEIQADIDQDFEHMVYIEHGYRRNFTKSELFFSICQIHNQTSNIWSHLIGFFCVCVVTLQKFTEGAPLMTPYGDLFFDIYLLCAALCLALSSTYHWFGCYNTTYHKTLLRLDLTGVGLLVAGSFFPAMYYGFYCLPSLQINYLALSTLVLVIGLWAPWIDLRIRGIHVRPFVFAGLVVVGLIPCTHWVLITPRIYQKKLLKVILC